MNRIFAITTDKKEATLTLGDDRQGKVAFTVTNSTERAIRGQLRLKPIEPTKAEWLNIAGESERDFPPQATQPVEVTVNIPAAIAAGKYNFRLDAVSVVNPDEDFTEGPDFALEVKPKKDDTKPFPWWIVIVAAVVLIAVSVGVWLFMRPKMVEVPRVETMTAAAAKEELEAKKLKVKIESQEKCGATKEEVITQNPAKGTSVKEDSEVILTVAVPVKPLKLENYVGKKIDEVKTLLAQKCIFIDEKRIGDDSKPDGTILTQDLKADTEVKEGGKIAFTIAVPLIPFDLPDVTTKSFLEAEKLLKDKGLVVIGNPLEDGTKPHLQVTRQSPLAHKQIKAGETVELTYYQTLVAVPDGAGLFWTDYQKILNQRDLHLGKVTGNCSNKIESWDFSGTRVPKGTMVSVFLGGNRRQTCYDPLAITLNAVAVISGSIQYQVLPQTVLSRSR